MATRRRRPRGHIEERPNGTFRAIVYAGTDPLTGKPRRLKETAADWNTAQEALTRLQRQVDERQHPRTSVTVGQVVGQWLEVARHEDSTRERYDQLCRLYIEPTFGAMAAGKVDAELLERFYARLLACRELCDGRRRAGHTCEPLAPNTIRKVHFIFRAAFERGATLAHHPAHPARPSPAVQRRRRPHLLIAGLMVRLGRLWAVERRGALRTTKNQRERFRRPRPLPRCAGAGPGSRGGRAGL